MFLLRGVVLIGSPSECYLLTAEPRVQWVLTWYERVDELKLEKLLSEFVQDSHVIFLPPLLHTELSYSLGLNCSRSLRIRHRAETDLKVQEAMKNAVGIPPRHRSEHIKSYIRDITYLLVHTAYAEFEPCDFVVNADW
jgi:hypothetical protein